jgi:hypothetical protein
LVFEGEAARCSFEKHESFAKALCRLLSQTPEIPAAVEVVIRRCYYHGEGDLPEGADEVATEEAVAGDGDAVEAALEAEDRGGAGEAVTEDGDEVGAEAREDIETGNADERSSGMANREGADRVGVNEGTGQQADIGNGVEYEGHADAGERAEADIEIAEVAERLEETATDERVSGPGESVSGFCFTAYVTGFGDSDYEPRLRWQIALALLQNALVQLARD